jgi:hypothetical protein
MKATALTDALEAACRRELARRLDDGRIAEDDAWVLFVAEIGPAAQGWATRATNLNTVLVWRRPLASYLTQQRRNDAFTARDAPNEGDSITAFGPYEFAQALRRSDVTAIASLGSVLHASASDELLACMRRTARAIYDPRVMAATLLRRCEEQAERIRTSAFACATDIIALAHATASLAHVTHDTTPPALSLKTLAASHMPDDVKQILTDVQRERSARMENASVRSATVAPILTWTSAVAKQAKATDLPGPLSNDAEKETDDMIVEMMLCQ